jgi:hypothetical protein
MRRVLDPAFSGSVGAIKALRDNVFKAHAARGAE